MRWFNPNRDDEIIHLRLENTRLLGIIETLSKNSPVPPSPVTRVRAEPDWHPAKGGVMTRGQALDILQKALTKRNEDGRVDSNVDRVAPVPSNS